MARVVMGVGTSHSTMLVVDGHGWDVYQQRDPGNRDLYDLEGRRSTFDELADSRGDTLSNEVAPERLVDKWTRCQTSLDRLAADLSEVDPDVVVIVGNDQLELFQPSNMPSLALFYGDAFVMGELPGKETPGGSVIAHGYAMDAQHEYPGSAKLARGLIEHLVDQGFDVAGVNEIVGPPSVGVGHAVGFVQRRLLRDGSVPVVPVWVNAMYAPNQPTPTHCYDIGRALRQAIESDPSDARVAVLASGGLSHYVVHEELDRAVIRSFLAKDEQSLRNLPTHLLTAGSAEIRNWVTVAGAIEDLEVTWSEYVPCYRTLAGTGCGMAFARWA